MLTNILGLGYVLQVVFVETPTVGASSFGLQRFWLQGV